MDLLATLRRSGGIDALARQLALSPPVVSAGADALLPALVGGFREYALSRGRGEAGISALLDVIDAQGDGDLATKILGPGPITGEAGERLLSHFFGSPQAGAHLSAGVARASGQDAALLESVLPFLTMLLCGYISARAEAESGTDWLRDLLMLDQQASRVEGGSES